jgi:hypothetical protein
MEIIIVVFEIMVFTPFSIAHRISQKSPAAVIFFIKDDKMALEVLHLISVSSQH